MKRFRSELERTLAIMILLTAAAAYAADPADDPLESVLQRLGTGSTAERNDALDALEDVLDDAAAGHLDPAQFDGVLRRLRLLVRAQPDDWIAVGLYDRAVDAFRFSADISALPAEALRSSSPNVRLRAVRWFMDTSDPTAVPQLEALWRSETHSWIRAFLVLALSNQGVRPRDDELKEILRDNDPALARAAVRSLIGSTDPSVLPTLLAAAHDGGPELRAMAILALGEYSDSAAALDEILAASRDSDEDLRCTAVPLLGGFTDPRAADRLERIVRSGEPPTLRVLALEKLLAIEDPRLDELARALAGDAAEVAPVRYAARDALLERGFVPDLTDDEFERSLERGNDATLPCGLSSRWSSDGELAYGRIRPPAGPRTVRCWSAPGIELDSEVADRLHEGLAVEIDDYFERDEELWIQVTSDDGDECWVRDEAVERLEEPASDNGPDAEGGECAGDEFDLPAEELDTLAAAVLLDEHLLEVIEEGERVVGVVLRAPSTDAERATIGRVAGEAPATLSIHLESFLRRSKLEREP